MKTATEPPAPAESDEFMTVGEVAKLLRVTPMTVYSEIHAGHLFAIRVGRRRLRVPVESYRAYKNRGQSSAEPESASVPAAA